MMRLLSALKVLLLVLPASLLAQQPSEPDIENNIVCYAAKNKWVCAPADDQAQAQEKARKLALGQTLEETDDIDPAVIQQVTEGSVRQPPVSRQPNPDEAILSQISDFIPRSDALKQPADEVENQPPEDRPDSVPEATAVAQTEPPVISQPQAEVSSQNLPAPADNGSAPFSNWQTQHPTRWSFQVIGTSNRHKLDEFINRHQLSQWPFSIVKTEVNGADWWVVLVGLYDSRDSAIANRDQLPAVLASGAWVRQISTINGESG